MFCKNCGSQIDDNAAVCPHCGVATDNYKTAPTVNETNTIAIVGFILSFFIAIAGLICSIIGYKKAKEMNGTGKGFALAGIIISAIEIVLTVIIYIAVIAAAMSITVA